MKCIVCLLLLFSLTFITNSQSIDKYRLNNTKIHRNQSSNSIVYNKVLDIFPLKNHSAGLVFLGQISGLATSLHNHSQLVIFHRGSREWNEKSFPDGYHFDRKNLGPIEEQTVLTVDIGTGEIVHEWGNNSFFMPHGLFIDNDENVWLTDVAMHQVFKYSNGEKILTLGESFVPGDDHLHFCKPTDVVRSDDKLFLYVADGYCNSRIVKFDSNGTFLKQYKMPEGEKQLFIPHSLVLIESLHLICVADRQNGRIVCFDTAEPTEGQVKYMIEYPSMNTVYAITYHPKKNLLYAVSGKDLINEALGYTFSAHPDSFGHLLQTWKSTNTFAEPHDLALSADSYSLFVGGIRPNLIHLFDVLN